jgi:transcriptional regulator with XRE-family HTH domain
MPVRITQVVYRDLPKPKFTRLIGHAATRWGDILRAIREEQDVSQRQLAEMAGVNRNALRRFEKNSSGSSMEMVERLAKVLGYSFDLYLETKELPA